MQRGRGDQFQGVEAEKVPAHGVDRGLPFAVIRLGCQLGLGAVGVCPEAVFLCGLQAAEYSPSPALDKEIREFCNGKLAEYKWVRLLEFVAEMPKTISGKIRKAELRKA